jgi:hypothetical protein
MVLFDSKSSIPALTTSYEDEVNIFLRKAAIFRMLSASDVGRSSKRIGAYL